MKMSTQKIRMAVMLLLCVLLAPLSLQAQNVTVHPGNGSMMPALKSGNTDTFYGWGGFATWKHEQLSLTMTTGDSDNNLTDRIWRNNLLFECSRSVHDRKNNYMGSG